MDMSNDSEGFRTAAQLAEAGAIRESRDWLLTDGTRMTPLYEAKMVDLFDHRAGSYEGRGDDRGFRVLPPTTAQQYSDPAWLPEPFYWVKSSDVEDRLALSTYQLLERPKVVGWAEGFGAGWRCAAGRA